MKNQHILSVFFASAVIFSSCAKDENPAGTPVEEGQDAVISLSLTGSQPSAKSTNPLPSQTADNTINKIMVFVFNSANQEIDRVKSATASEVSSKIVSVSATTGQRDIYIVANFASADSANLVNSTTTTELKNVLANIKTENEGNFKMIGKKLNQTITTSANNITVMVSRLVARVTLANITANFTGGLAAKSLAVDSVYLLNVTGTKSYGDSAVIVAPSTIFNRTESGFLFPIFDAYSSAVNVGNSNAYITGKPDGNHFYVYANNGTTFANSTKLVITGLLNGIRTYYPIAINVAGNGYSPVTAGITANSQYSITVNISGFGSTDPNTPVLSATLTITVTPQNWATVINQGVSF